MVRRKHLESIKPIPINQPADLTNYFFANGWRQQAPCRGSSQELFFPDRGDSTREAKALCHDCLVRLDCLEDAIANNERFGIWGGLPERTRRRVKHLMQNGWDIKEALSQVEEERQNPRKGHRGF